MPDNHRQIPDQHDDVPDDQLTYDVDVSRLRAQHPRSDDIDEHIIIDPGDVEHVDVHDTAGNDYVLVRRDDYDKLAAIVHHIAHLAYNDAFANDVFDAAVNLVHNHDDAAPDA
jgi:hypothetical protein